MEGWPADIFGFSPAMVADLGAAWEINGEKIHAIESVVRTQEKNCERSDVTRLHLLLLLLVVVVVVVVPGYQDVVIVMLLFPGQGNRNRNGQEMKKDMETETETDKKWNWTWTQTQLCLLALHVLCPTLKDTSYLSSKWFSKVLSTETDQLEATKEV